MMKELVKHLFPRLVREGDLRLRYTFCLGGLAFTSLLVLIATGVLLLFYYSPSPERAHDSIRFLETGVWGGAYVRSLHRLASHALLLLVALHVLRVILTGAFLHPKRMNWIVGCLLLLIAVFGAYTGYLLPMDQLAFWATTTGMELLRSLPGGEAAALAAGARRHRRHPDPAALLRTPRRDRPLRPVRAHDASLLRDPPAEGAAAVPMNRYVRSSPHFFRPVKRALVALVVLLLVLAALVPAPLGPKADPAHPPNPAKSAWYLLWVQELVSWSTPAVFLALALVLALVALPWLALPRLEHARWLPPEHRRVQVAVLLAAFLVLALTLVGLFLRGPDWRLVSPF